MRDSQEYQVVPGAYRGSRARVAAANGLPGWHHRFTTRNTLYGSRRGPASRPAGHGDSSARRGKAACLLRAASGPPAAGENRGLMQTFS